MKGDELSEALLVKVTVVLLSLLAKSAASFGVSEAKTEPTLPPPPLPSSQVEANFVFNFVEQYRRLLGMFALFSVQLDSSSQFCLNCVWQVL